MCFKKQKNTVKSGGVEWIIAGLGNPGKKYLGTRHNAGFMVLEQFANNHRVRLNKIQFKSYTTQVQINGTKVLLMMPQTFMNLSGDAVREAMQYYKLDPEQVLVIYDDIALDVGTIRIRRNGSDGGQKGIRSIIQSTSSQDFPRIKVGIGHKPHPDYDLVDWVLSQFSANEKPRLASAIDNACNAAEMIVQGEIEAAMSKYSR